MVCPPEVRFTTHPIPHIELSAPSYLFSCATTGEGLFEGLQWLSQNVRKRQQEFSSLRVAQLTQFCCFTEP